MEILNSASKIAMLTVLFALVGLNAGQIEVMEPLKSLAIMIVGYYFGGKNSSLVEPVAPATPVVAATTK